MKYRDGAFLFYRTSSACVPMTPQEIEELARHHGIPAHIVPQYAGDRVTVSRAITANTWQRGRQHILIRPITQTRTAVVCRIITEHKDQEAECVDHHFDDRLRWHAEGGMGGPRIAGSHPAAQQIDATFQSLRGKIVAGDWSESLTDYLQTDCQAQAMRADGRVYWVPPSGLPLAR